MEENLVKVALKKDAEENRRPAVRTKEATVREWLGAGFGDRALGHMEEKKRRWADKAVGNITLGALCILALAMLLPGCVTSRPAPLAPVNGYKAVDFTASYVPGRTIPSQGRGSLFPGSQFRNPISDRRAAFINDLVTVEIVEDSSASGKAQTKTGRDSSVGAGVQGLLGFEQTIARAKPNMNLDSLVAAKTKNSFDGSGETSRQTKVLSTMTCTVVDSLPNGNLRIRGKRMIKVNGEDQIITLSGIVRPEDIDGANSIVSTRVADARITYYGSGVINDKQKPGWMMRAFDNVWPF